MSMKSLAAILFGSLVLLSCGDVKQESSESKWVKLSDFPDWAQNGKLQNICFTGSHFRGKSDQVKRKEASRVLSGFQQWFDILHAFENYIAPVVTPVFADIEAECALRVYLGTSPIMVVWEDSDGRASANVHGIRLFNGDDESVMVHEAGHVLGLGDTYVENVWTCQPGQPNSIMCNYNNETNRFSIDDVQGIHALYCQKYPCKRIAYPRMHYYESNTNRYGSDIDVKLGLDIGQCQDACRDNAQCQSWTHVPANRQGPETRCWLKNGTPRPNNEPAHSSGVKIVGAVTIQGLPNTNLPGLDYTSFGVGERMACDAQCRIESECKAYTWVPGGDAGGTCWLKK